MRKKILTILCFLLMVVCVACKKEEAPTENENTVVFGEGEETHYEPKPEIEWTEINDKEEEILLSAMVTVPNTSICLSVPAWQQEYRNNTTILSDNGHQFMIITRIEEEFDDLDKILNLAINNTKNDASDICDISDVYIKKQESMEKDGYPVFEALGEWACNGSKIPFVGYAIKTDTESFVVLGTCVEDKYEKMCDTMYRVVYDSMLTETTNEITEE